MENNKCFLSVVIPLYNVEKYLESCLDSVLAAAIEDMEIVLIDDGSKDSSPAICDRYAAAHDHIRVIHQQNQGISVTRNVGIENACGEYIFFLDSDDRVHEDIFRKFAQFINDREYRPDMVLCNAEFVHIFNDKRVPMTLRADPSKIENVSGEQAVREILRTEPSFEW
jgi:glycosyltransferase involved in cell wall biosynthesis